MEPLQLLSHASQLNSPSSAFFNSTVMLGQQASPTKIPATSHFVVMMINEAMSNSIDPEVILEGTELCYDELYSPSLNLTREQELTAFENLQKQMPHLAIGLAMGKKSHVSCFGLAGYTLLLGANVTAAMSCLQAFPLLMGLYYNFKVSKKETNTWVSIEDYSYSANLEIMFSDMCLATIVTLVSDVLGYKVLPKAVMMSRAKPANYKEYEAFFECEILYGAEHNAVCFATELFDDPLPLANEVSFRTFYKMCQNEENKLATQVSEDILFKVKQLLRQDINIYNSLPKVAAKLCLSERTLRRKLERHATSFQQLLDEVRSYEACQLLNNTELKIADIACLLGYSDTACFRHAFQRWTGKNPSLFRQLSFT